MKNYARIKDFCILCLLALFCISCDDNETYADQKKAERSNISRFIEKNGINVITEEQFKEQNYTTDVSKNQYVLLANSGVYLQIVEKGCGNKIKNGETVVVLCRFVEKNVETGDYSLTNNTNFDSRFVDKMTVTNSSGTFTGSFISTTQSLLAYTYGNGSTYVPSGWLIPLTYINIGRPEKEDDSIAKVNLIVPHTQGHPVATSEVTPYFYSLSYERGI